MKTLAEILQRFDELEWPMHLLGTGVDMEMIERDKQIKSFLRQAIRDSLSACEPELIKKEIVGLTTAYRHYRYQYRENVKSFLGE